MSSLAAWRAFEVRACELFDVCQFGSCWQIHIRTSAEQQVAAAMCSDFVAAVTRTLATKFRNTHARPGICAVWFTQRLSSWLLMSFPDCHLSRQLLRDENSSTEAQRENLCQSSLFFAANFSPQAEPEIGFSAPSLTTSLAAAIFTHPLLYEISNFCHQQRSQLNLLFFSDDGNIFKVVRNQYFSK